MNATAAEQFVSTNHESIVNDESKLHETFGIGDAVHQGDIIIIGINGLPPGAKHRANRQLADGSTQGSRHVMTRGKVFDCDPESISRAIKDATGIRVDARYCGPVFVSPKNPTADDLSHPEHGNHGFPAGQVCAVVFQRNLDAEQREQRVRD